MKKTKILYRFAGAAATALVLSGAVLFYLFNMPDRNIEKADIDYEVTAQYLIEEYLQDYDAANQKYLADDGESSIFSLKAKLLSVEQDFNGQPILIIGEENLKAAVSCGFSSDYNYDFNRLEIGQSILIKGVIEAGARYDEDLMMYENIQLGKCVIL